MHKPATLAAVMLVSTSITASAASPCPFPLVQECRPTTDKMRPPACRCVHPPGSPTWGGKAEIHKKNVPTVKPNRNPAGNR